MWICFHLSANQHIGYFYFYFVGNYTANFLVGVYMYSFYRNFFRVDGKRVMIASQVMAIHYLFRCWQISGQGIFHIHGIVWEPPFYRFCYTCCWLSCPLPVRYMCTCPFFIWIPLMVGEGEHTLFTIHLFTLHSYILLIFKVFHRQFSLLNRTFSCLLSTNPLPCIVFSVHLGFRMLLIYFLLKFCSCILFQNYLLYGGILNVGCHFFQMSHQIVFLLRCLMNA